MARKRRRSESSRSSRKSKSTESLRLEGGRVEKEEGEDPTSGADADDRAADLAGESTEADPSEDEVGTTSVSDDRAADLAGESTEADPSEDEVGTTSVSDDRAAGPVARKAEEPEAALVDGPQEGPSAEGEHALSDDSHKLLTPSSAGGRDAEPKDLHASSEETLTDDQLRPAETDHVDPLEDTSPTPVQELRSYAARLLDRRWSALATLISEYATRLERVDRGDLPRAFATPPIGLSPSLVGDVLGTDERLAKIEGLRNALIFAPVLWTWFEIGRATRSFAQYVEARRTEEIRPFLELWGEGFGGVASSFVAMAWGAAALISLLVFATVWLNLARGRQHSAQIRLAHDVAATLARAELIAARSRPSDPVDALDGFAQTGQALTTTLREVGTSLGALAAPFAESLQETRSVMQEMSTAVGSQAQQLNEVTTSLSKVAQIGEQLGALQADMASATSALGLIQQSMGPTSTQLVRSVDELSELSNAIGGAASDLTTILERIDGGAVEFQESMRILTDVANRLGDEARNVMTEMSGAVQSQASELSRVTTSLGEVAKLGEQLGAVRTDMSHAAEALGGIQESMKPVPDLLGDGIGEFKELATEIARAASEFNATLARVDSGALRFQEGAQVLNSVANRLADALEPHS